MIASLAQLSVWPVLQRELREGARRKANHWLRLLSAGVGTLVLWRVTANSDESANQMSGWLLGSLHAWFLVLVLALVPALTADCLAQEKRDGTLGLLFLTPLSAGGIVVGKVLARVLRTFILWLAVLPLLTISFLGGGVTWLDALSALSLEFCATVLCVAAGLLASALARERGTVFVLAYGLSALFWLGFALVFECILVVAWQGFSIPTRREWLSMVMEGLPLFAGLLDMGGVAGWSRLGAVSSVLMRLWKWLCLAGPVASVGLCALVGWLAAVAIERSWQERVPSARRQSWLRRYCTPLWRQHFQRRSQRCLDWNPIAWLQHYSWKARLSRLGLCLGFVIVVCLAFDLEPDTRGGLARLLLLILAACYSSVGVSGFLEEKRSGALELLLVTPLSPTAIIFGRAWGLWKQFLPAGLILAGFQIYALWRQTYELRCWQPEETADVPSLIMLAGGFFVLPVFATYFALRVKHWLAAAVLTWVALFLPVIFANMAADLVPGVGPTLLPLFSLLTNGTFALLACWLLRHSLSRRLYSF